MPIHLRKDRKGFYFQWGNHGTKYYFDPHDPRSKERAYRKALRQGRAIWWRRKHGK